MVLDVTQLPGVHVHSSGIPIEISSALSCSNTDKLFNFQVTSDENSATILDVGLLSNECHSS